MSDAISPAQQRLNQIWRDYLSAGAKRSLTDEVRAEARRLYGDLADPNARIATHRMFGERGCPVADEAPPLPRERFIGDWWVGDAGALSHPAFDGYYSGKRWNGWEEPLVTLEVLKALIPIINSDGGVQWSLRDDDVLIVEWNDEDASGEDAEVFPEHLQTVDGELPLYNLGMGLVWTAEREVVPPPAVEDIDKHCPTCTCNESEDADSDVCTSCGAIFALADAEPGLCLACREGRR